MEADNFRVITGIPVSSNMVPRVGAPISHKMIRFSDLRRLV